VIRHLSLKLLLMFVSLYSFVLTGVVCDFYCGQWGNFYFFCDRKIKRQVIQENPTRCNSVSKYIIPYLYEAQHVWATHRQSSGA
jgi:hypothetical protein